MSRSSTGFVRISQGEWRLSDCMDRRRRRRLQSETTYEQIIWRVIDEATVLEHKREEACLKPGFFRVVVTLKVEPETVDLFHNSAAGYRAQYYLAASNGDCANAYALKQLAPRIRKLVDGQAKRTCPCWWVEKSLLDANAKLWIHQGHWLRHAKRNDRHLRVLRWIDQQACRDSDRRKKAVWASLTPNQEARLELKGGFLECETDKPLGSLKSTRAQDIHELGFT